jgi:hypothetical protein
VRATADVARTGAEQIWIDANGALTERRWLGKQAVIVHYDDVPDKDLTTVDEPTARRRDRAAG